MNGLKRLIQNEPTMLVGFINAVMALLVLYGVDMTDEQSAGIIVVVNMALAIANRMMVTPVTRVNEQVDAAVEDALTAEAEPMTDEQRQIVNDLREIRDTLRRKVEGAS